MHLVGFRYKNVTISMIITNVMYITLNENGHKKILSRDRKSNIPLPPKGYQVRLAFPRYECRVGGGGCCAHAQLHSVSTSAGGERSNPLTGRFTAGKVPQPSLKKRLRAPKIWSGRFGAKCLVAVGIQTPELPNRNLVLSTTLSRISSVFIDHENRTTEELHKGNWACL